MECLAGHRAKAAGLRPNRPHSSRISRSPRPRLNEMRCAVRPVTNLGQRLSPSCQSARLHSNRLIGVNYYCRSFCLTGRMKDIGYPIKTKRSGIHGRLGLKSVDNDSRYGSCRASRRRRCQPPDAAKLTARPPSTSPVLLGVGLPTPTSPAWSGAAAFFPEIHHVAQAVHNEALAE